MKSLVGNYSTETNQESYRLLAILDTLERELEQPYIERRLKSSSHKSSPFEELQDAIQELTQREKDLQASIGISKVLIESNENILQKNQALSEFLQESKNENSRLKEEISMVKDEFEILEIKYQEANSLLVKTESKFLKVIAESRKNHTETVSSPKLVEQDIDDSIDRYEKHIAELTEKFRIEHESLLSNFYIGQKVDLEKKNKAANEKLQESANSLKSLENQIEEDVKRIRVLEKNLKKTEQELAEETNAREDTEKLYDELFNKHKHLLALTEKQAEEIEIIQLSTPKNNPTPTHKETSSLQLELEDLDDQELEVDALEVSSKKIFTFPFNDLRKSFRMAPRTLGIHKQSNILIPYNRPTRKSPCEEYFFLSTQAIKLNSVYLDSICTISPNLLYASAMKNEIPFQKWQAWIERQLNASYLASIYRRDSKSFR